MAIQGDASDLAKGGYHRRADRKIGYEVAVHDVDVEDGGAAVDRRLCLLA
jgi:hypothetical protein